MANGCEDEQTKSVVFLSASDDEDENKEDLGEFERKSPRSSVVIDLSSDEVDFIADRRIRAVEMAVEAEVEVKNKKKRKRSKKKKIEQERIVRRISSFPTLFFQKVYVFLVCQLKNSTCKCVFFFLILFWPSIQVICMWEKTDLKRIIGFGFWISVLSDHHTDYSVLMWRTVWCFRPLIW